MKKVEIDELDFYGYWSYEEEPFTGLAYELFADGSVMSEINIVGGVEDGVQIEYYEKGKLKNKLYKRENLIHGYSFDWYENGRIKIESLIEYGIVVWQKHYDENGRLEYNFEINKHDDQFKLLKSLRKKKNWKINR